MSAINFNLGVDTQEDPKGGDPRIVITLTVNSYHSVHGN